MVGTVQNEGTQQDAKVLLEKLLANVAPADMDDILRTIRKEKRGRKGSGLSLQMKGHIASVAKHVNGVLVAIHKLQDLGQEIPESVWGKVEGELNRLCVGTYRETALKTQYLPRTGKGGRPRKNRVEQTQTTEVMSAAETEKEQEATPFQEWKSKQEKQTRKAS